jgi:hypothetical protein
VEQEHQIVFQDQQLLTQVEVEVVVLVVKQLVQEEQVEVELE